MTIPTGSKEEMEGGPELPCGAKIAAPDHGSKLEAIGWDLVRQAWELMDAGPSNPNAFYTVLADLPAGGVQCEERAEKVARLLRAALQKRTFALLADQSAEAEGVGDAAQVSPPIREAPTLPSREELERALREIKGLNDQLAGEGPIARRIDEIASRALTSKEQNNG